MSHAERRNKGHRNLGLIGLEHLKGMTKLQSLGLDESRVTEAGLERLSGLTKLTYLSLTGTNVSDEGIKKLQQALPNCVIGQTSV